MTCIRSALGMWLALYGVILAQPETTLQPTEIVVRLPGGYKPSNALDRLKDLLPHSEFKTVSGARVLSVPAGLAQSSPERFKQFLKLCEATRVGGMVSNPGLILEYDPKLSEKNPRAARMLSGMTDHRDLDIRIRTASRLNGVGGIIPKTYVHDALMAGEKATESTAPTDGLRRGNFRGYLVGFSSGPEGRYGEFLIPEQQVLEKGKTVLREAEVYSCRISVELPDLFLEALVREGLNAANSHTPSDTLKRAIEVQLSQGKPSLGAQGEITIEAIRQGTVKVHRSQVTLMDMAGQSILVEENAEGTKREIRTSEAAQRLFSGLWRQGVRQVDAEILLTRPPPGRPRASTARVRAVLVKPAGSLQPGTVGWFTPSGRFNSGGRFTFAVDGKPGVGEAVSWEHLEFERGKVKSMAGKYSPKDLAERIAELRPHQVRSLAEELDLSLRGIDHTDRRWHDLVLESFEGRLASQRGRVDAVHARVLQFEEENRTAAERLGSQPKASTRGLRDFLPRGGKGKGRLR